MNKPNRTVVIAAVSVALLGAVGIGYWWGRSRENGTASTTSEGAQPADRNALYWYDPMVPDQHFDKPGKSPFMDMQLVPKYAGESSEGGISIASDVRQNLGVRTIVVKRGQLAAEVRVPGTIGWDLRQERIVSARVDSVVERLYVRAPFEPVRAGQPLVSVIAPTWSAAIAEAQALGQARSSSARALQSASHERLRALGLPAGAGGGRGGRITLTAPVTGVVSEIGVREGQSAPMGTLLFRVNGTGTVWLEAAIPQAGITGIAAGTSVEAAVDALPGEVFHGRVETLLPLVDMGSRTQRARIVLDNPGGLLAPGMFAQITLRPVAGVEHPLVPSDALIGAGAQARVIVLGDDDKFRPVVVQTGRSSGGMTEILAGLKGGERIVASGQFLIDSEANLSGALERLGADTAESSDAANEEVAAPSDDMPTNMDMRPSSQAAPVPATPRTMAPRKKAAPATPPKPVERKVLYWYDPMMPDKHFDKPGKSPYMDMQLVPKYADETDAATPERQP